MLCVSYESNMKITKYGHCCLLIEVDGLRILTDPGSYSEGFENFTDIHVVLITHEHPDHLHIDSLKTVLKNNSDAKIITNTAVGKLLNPEKIVYEIVDHKKSTTEKGVLIEGFGKDHALMYETLPVVENTGYMIANRLFYPGDAWTNPNRNVEILALPVAGPWMKIAEAVDYAKMIKPKVCFPVHDGGLKKPGVVHVLPPKILTPLGIGFKVIEINQTTEL